MFPPLPPFPPPPHHHQQRHVPQHVHMAMRLSPSVQQQAWYAQYSYGKHFPDAPPPHRQPFTPRNTMTNVPPRGMSNAPLRGSTWKVAPVVRRPRAPLQANDKENQLPVNEPTDENTQKVSYVQVLKGETSPPKATDVRQIWPTKPAREALQASVSKETNSIWNVTPLDLTSMILHARREKSLARRTKTLQTKKPSRSNQETHEWDYQSDSSREAGSDTDTEDEDLPVLKKCYGFHFFTDFPCDREGVERSTSISSTTTNKNQPIQRYKMRDQPAALDYRKLFAHTRTKATPGPPDLVPFEMAPTCSEGTTPAHMLWWPGDWKCATCGNHNFSYRELCKRCREGRYHEAGFIFPLQA